MVEKHNCNVMDRQPGFAQDLIQGTENTVIDILVEVGNQINEELTPFKLAVVVEDSPLKRNPAKKGPLKITVNNLSNLRPKQQSRVLLVLPNLKVLKKNIQKLFLVKSL